MDQPSWLYQTPSLSAGPQQSPASQPTQSVMPSPQPSWGTPDWLSGTTSQVQRSEGWPTSSGGWGGNPTSLAGNNPTHTWMPEPTPQLPPEYVDSYPVMGGGRVGVKAAPAGYEWDFGLTAVDGPPVLRKIGAQTSRNIFGQAEDPVIRDSYKLFSDYDPNERTGASTVMGGNFGNPTQVQQNQQGGLMQLLQSLFSSMGSSRAVSSQYANLTPQQRRMMG